MLIKLEAVKDTMLGKSKAKQVVGTRLDDGKEWSKAFFANKKDLSDQIAEFKMGDTVNVELVQEGQFWNIKSFKVPTKEDIEKASAGYKPRVSAPQGQSVRRPDGGSRGDDTNRSAAIYLAKEVVLASEIDKYDWKNILEHMFTAADMIYDYIKNGVAIGGDPLAPPKVD